MGAFPYAIHVNAGWRMKFTKLMCKRPPYGGIRAIDVATGKTLWDGRSAPPGATGRSTSRPLLPFSIGTPNNGGAVTTASGLVFIAAATDDLIRAVDLKTGKTVWSAPLPAGGQANPIIYQQDGREYLVIVAGATHFMENADGRQRRRLRPSQGMKKGPPGNADGPDFCELDEES